MAGESFILMGVSGSGKTLIGSKVAALLSAKFIDGDDLHPAKNIDKCRRVFHYLMKIDFLGWNA